MYNIGGKFVYLLLIFFVLLNTSIMSKLTSIQIINLLHSKVTRDLSNYRTLIANHPSYDLYASGRISVLEDILSAINFYRDYDYE